ncbi:hypothetical protein BH09MYX1_BH09MYX1_38280 [soil metagenome]
MKLLFDEEMPGVTADGRRFNLRLQVEAQKVRSLLLAREMRLTGEADLERVVTGAKLEGTLVVGLPWQRRMRYAIAFHDAAGARYRFVGRKTVRYLTPRESLTTLTGEITKDGDHLTDAVVAFQWAALPAFFRSFRLAPG